MALLVCRDLAVGYDGKSVLEGISFKVEKGDYLFITGANGTGKSTLMKSRRKDNDGRRPENR